MLIRFNIALFSVLECKLHSIRGIFDSIQYFLFPLVDRIYRNSSTEREREIQITKATIKS